MSGTAYGTIVLHCSPEAAIGGPLALVKDGDRIRLDVPTGRSICWWMKRSWSAAGRARTSGPPERGWSRLYAQSVVQASEGADLDFLAER